MATRRVEDLLWSPATLASTGDDVVADDPRTRGDFQVSNLLYADTVVQTCQHPAARGC